MAAALFGLGRLKGIDRPAIGTVIPTPAGPKLLLDMGANTDCRPKNLVQFAYLGSIYTEQVLKVNRPKVALLNIGEEETKGNEAVLAAYQQLKAGSLNFVGNVEGRDLFKQRLMWWYATVLSAMWC
jgi:glycerol-3-phosphate acyltransferase PlsX